jgi:hypothetical protein
MAGDATAAETLAEFVTKEDLERKQLYPAFPNIRNISAKIAAGVAAAAYDLGKQIITFALQDYIPKQVILSNAGFAHEFCEYYILLHIACIFSEETM